MQWITIKQIKDKIYLPSWVRLFVETIDWELDFFLPSNIMPDYLYDVSLVFIYNEFLPEKTLLKKGAEQCLNSSICLI